MERRLNMRPQKSSLIFKPTPATLLSHSLSLNFFCEKNSKDIHTNFVSVRKIVSLFLLNELSFLNKGIYLTFYGGLKKE